MHRTSLSTQVVNIINLQCEIRTGCRPKVKDAPIEMYVIGVVVQIKKIIMHGK